VGHPVYLNPDAGVDSRLENCSAAANPAEALEQEYVHISSEWW